MDESRRLAMRRAHTKHVDHCTCGRNVCGNGGKAVHRAMHARRKDGHYSVVHDIWKEMFPGHDGRTERVPEVSLDVATASWKRRNAEVTERIAARHAAKEQA